MDAKEFLNKDGWNSDDGLGLVIRQTELIELLDEYSDHQNKCLIEENERLIKKDKERGEENKRILRYLNEY